MNWTRCMHSAKDVFGTEVNRQEGFFICPDCGEPIYESDWTEMDFNPGGGFYTGTLVCPVCDTVLWVEGENDDPC